MPIINFAGLSFGALCSVLFHILVREKNQTVLERSEAGTGSRSTRHLLKDYKTYQVKAYNIFIY